MTLQYNFCTVRNMKVPCYIPNNKNTLVIKCKLTLYAVYADAWLCMIACITYLFAGMVGFHPWINITKMIL